MKKQSSLARLFAYAGNYKYLTILSWILSVISAWIALVPFYYIWKIIREVLNAAPEYSQVEHLSSYGWSAVLSALLSMGNLYWCFDVLSYCSVSRAGKYEIRNDASYCDIAIRLYG